MNVKILLEPQVIEAKCGILARSQELGLCACGRDKGEALKKLAKGVRIWSAGLAKEGTLLEALKRANVRYTGEDASEAVDSSFDIGVEFQEAELKLENCRQ
jgi:hypothetical protein